VHGFDRNLPDFTTLTGISTQEMRVIRQCLFKLKFGDDQAVWRS
jgi:hypothetical protein